VRLERLSPVWLPYGVYQELVDVARRLAVTRLATALRQAVYYASWKLASLTAREVEELAREAASLYGVEPPRGWAQLGRLREVALNLHSTYPLRKIARALRDVFGREMARNFAAAFAVHLTYRLLGRRLPELEESLLRSAWEAAERKATSLAEFKRALIQELELRAPLARDKALWNDVIRLAKLDVAKVAELIGRRPRERSVRPVTGEFRRILKRLVEEAGGDARRFYFLFVRFRGLLERAMATEEDAVAYSLLVAVGDGEALRVALDLLQ